MSIVKEPPIGENGENEPMVEKLRVVESGSKFRVEVDDRDPNRINEHLQVKNKVKCNTKLKDVSSKPRSRRKKQRRESSFVYFTMAGIFKIWFRINISSFSSGRLAAQG